MRERPPKRSSKQLSRRGFLKGLVGLAAAAALDNVLPNTAEASEAIELANIDGNVAELSDGKNRLKIYNRGEGTVGCQIIRADRNTSQAVPVVDIAFTSRKDFGIKMSAPLNETFGSGRRNMLNDMMRVHDAFYSDQPAQKEQKEERAHPENIEQIDDHTFQVNEVFEGKSVQFQVQPGKRGVTISGEGKERVLYFANEGELGTRVSSWLNENIATAAQGRRSIFKEYQYIYKQLKLDTHTGKREPRERTEPHTTTSFLELDYGTYFMDHESENVPESYLLIENENKGGRYCLALVQAAYDMMYSSGAAREAGLYNERWAGDLRFGGEVAYDKNVHTDLPYGTIVRFNKNKGHIGVCLGGDKVMHLIEDTLYVDHLSSIIDDSYNVRGLIFPDAQLQQSAEQAYSTMDATPIGKLGKGRNIENIAYHVQKNFSLKEDSLNAIRETIFQLNRELFEVKHSKGRGDTTVVLAGNYESLRVPSEWMQ